MFISPAYAQDAGAAGDMFSGLGGLLPLVLIFVVFYFLLIRPQQKKAKAHRAMIAAVRRGDRVVTGGGIVGTVVRVKDNEDLQVEIAPDVRVRVLRGSIADVLARTGPAGSGDDTADEDDAESESDADRKQTS